MIEDNEDVLIECIDLFFEFVKHREYLREQQAADELVSEQDNFIYGVAVSIESIMVNDTLFLSDNDQI